MRWDRLFDDLEGQLAAQHLLERDAEVADRTRRERALLTLHDRLLACVGQRVTLVCGAGEVAHGTVLEVGAGWVMLAAPPGVVLAHVPAVRSLAGLGQHAHVPGVVARSFGLGMALRAVCRDRAPVSVVDVTGATLTGTVDLVGADHLDLAEHPLDLPRRPENVRGTRTIPYAALATLRRG
ncbi:MAG TPA: hypothetical protein PKZ38_10160 [Dermatophilaceae bacterium]|jgi:hypothetical protein|nr:hypothetical protein [Dermatophilaceae bacterium]HRC00435.1 hypothetical protein [Dermatophilaceae bacterium]